MNKLKINKTTSILTLNNKQYLPFQIHQLPKDYNDIPLSDIINLKGYIYIESSHIKNKKKFIDTITHNKDLHGRYKECR
tara:strand:+ start:364 stop:600 length:237 start_codon:yes stop_codon:yes gene_type:complete